MGGIRAGLRDECSALTVLLLVREHRVQFTVGKRHFVDGEMPADVVGKEHPLLRMFFLIPAPKPAQMVFVLFLELFNVNPVPDGD